MPTRPLDPVGVAPQPTALVEALAAGIRALGRAADLAAVEQAVAETATVVAGAVAAKLVLVDARAEPDPQAETWPSNKVVPCGEAPAVLRVGWDTPERPAPGELPALEALGTAAGLALARVRAKEEATAARAALATELAHVQAAQRRKDELAAYLVHDLRSPATASRC